MHLNKQVGKTEGRLFLRDMSLRGRSGSNGRRDRGETQHQRQEAVSTFNFTETLLLIKKE